MTDEAERIGGISIEASINDSRVDAELNALLARMQTASRQLSAALSITPTMVAAQTQKMQQTTSQMSYGRRAASGAEYSSLEKAIAEAQAKEDMALGRVAASTTKASRTKQSQMVSAIESSPIVSQPVAIAIDTEAAKEELASFLATFKASMAEAQGAARINIAIEQPTAQAVQAGERAAAAVVGGGGGGKRRKNIAAAAGGDGDEEQGRIGFQTRMAAYELREGDRQGARVQQQRRTSGQRAYAESERARRAELVSTSRQYDSLSAIAERYFDDEEARIARSQGISAKADEQRSLVEATYATQREGTNVSAASKSTFAGRTRTPTEIADFRKAEEAKAALISGPQAPVALARQTEDRRARSARLAAQSEERRHAGQEARDEAAGVGGGPRGGAGRRGPAVRRTEEDVARREQERIAAATGSRFTAGRTLRTFESSFGGFLGGGRAFVEAQAALAAANEKVRISQDRLRDPDVIRSRRATRQATEELTAAENERAKALERVESFSRPSAAIRTFAGIAVATVGFSLALKGLDVVLSAVTPALGDFIDMQTGFASKSTAVTSALAKQTLEQKGNVDAVFAQAAATAGLTKEASDFLSTQLKVTTQVKAGALAQQQTSDLFRAAAGAGQGAPQGLGGGFGGLFGSPLLAQQLGGGKGLQEIIAGDVRAFSKTPNRTGEFGDFPGTINDLLGATNPFGENFGDPGKQVDLRRQAASLAGATPELTKYLDDLNGAMKRSAVATGQNVKATFAYTTNQTEIANAAAISTAAGDDLGAGLARMGIVLRDSSGGIADFTTQLQALEQAAKGKSIVPTEQLGSLALAQERQRQREAAASLPALRSQFAYERPAFLAGLERQQQFQLQNQIPAQAALQQLANPILPPGTGQVAANADEQERIEKSTARTQKLQDQLNAYYKQGEQILVNTFQVPQQLVNDIRATGQAIAATQAGIRNEQAAYQVAQYNYQLHIARRTLADIGGLTGKNFGAGKSYLGVLERQNLALSRQGQLLQFSLQQRQINFQVALAGFQAPGVTPEERQANVKEAELEASFAQKQLDIQRKMFGNQVQIVDIQNLRQGADLAAQINLLLQGRKVTIDTVDAEANLARLQQIQQRQVAEAGTYIEKVSAVVSRAFGEIQSLETAAGKAMFNAATYAANAFNVYLTGIVSGLNSMAGQLGGQTQAHNPEHGATQYNASGVVGTTRGAMNMTIGEAGNETYAILRNPRSMDWGGGGGDISITFGDVVVRNDSDIDQIVRKVQTALGRDAALKGMRGVN